MCIQHLWVAGWGALFCVCMLGCDTANPSNSDDPDGFGGLPAGSQALFGDPYEIYTQLPLSNEAAPPRIQNDTLYVTVGYSGGCKTHAFDLMVDTSNPVQATLWLAHDADGDACEAYLVDPLRKAIPKSASGISRFLLRNPNGEPFMLEAFATE